MLHCGYFHPHPLPPPFWLPRVLSPCLELLCYLTSILFSIWFQPKKDSSYRPYPGSRVMRCASSNLFFMIRINFQSKVSHIVWDLGSNIGTPASHDKTNIKCLNQYQTPISLFQYLGHHYTSPSVRSDVFWHYFMFRLLYIYIMYICI